MRYQPPVHSSISLAALARAALDACVDARATRTQRAALAQLSTRYPEHHIVLTDSGTTALAMALRITKRTDHAHPIVALPAYACPDLGSAAIGAGFGIMLYDVEPSNLQPDFESVRRCMSAGATHVVAAHLYGRLVDVALLSGLARETGVTVLEDAAQHAGGTLRGVRGGALADTTVLSFGRGKGINAGGGGALLHRQNVPELRLTRATDRREFTLWAKALVGEALAHPSLYRIPASIPALGLGETRYHAPTPSGAMATVNARLLVSALDGEASMLSARRANERAFTDALHAQSVVALMTPLPDSEGGALRLPIQLSPARAERMASLGVVRSYPCTLAAYAEIRQHVVGAVPRLPGADALAASTFTLPTHSHITPSDRDRIVHALVANGA